MTRPIIQSLKIKDGQSISDGYRFGEDDVANQMAFLFSGEEGQKRAQAIREEAEKIADPHQRKLYIEEEVKKKAEEVDEEFQKGLTDIFNELCHLCKDACGTEAGKDKVVCLMKKLGLNVNPDNVQTHYSPGPPQCFQVTWINRPSPELKDKYSEINQLSKCYVNSLKPEEQQNFNAKWDTHSTNAKNDGPKMDKTTFEMESAKLWNDFKNKVKQEDKQSVKMTSSTDNSFNREESNSPRP